MVPDDIAADVRFCMYFLHRYITFHNLSKATQNQQKLGYYSFGGASKQNRKCKNAFIFVFVGCTSKVVDSY